MFLRVYQICYEEAQLHSLDYIPVLNKKCSPFFENSVIRILIEDDAQIGCEYFGVVSWKLRSKIGFEMKQQWRAMPNIANHSTNEFTPELFAHELRRHLPDVMSFQRHAPHDPVSYADQFHPNFSKYYREIMHKIGFNWQPTSFENVVYCNYHASKSETYARYVNEMLIPAMNIMKDMPELMGNSGYNQPLSERLKKDLGVSHYPYHAFLCERMFSYYIHIHKLKCVHY